MKLRVGRSTPDCNAAAFANKNAIPSPAGRVRPEHLHFNGFMKSDGSTELLC